MLEMGLGSEPALHSVHRIGPPKLWNFHLAWANTGLQIHQPVPPYVDSFHAELHRLHGTVFFYLNNLFYPTLLYQNGGEFGT